MEGRLVLKGCSIFRSDGRVRAGMAVVVEEDRVVKVAPDELVPVLPGDWEIACRGRLVMPGWVDCHAHLVGEQLVPSSGAHLMRSAPGRFAIRHRLAQAMTQAELEALTAWGMARSLRNGVTFVAEHLEAPSSVEASLETQARVALRLGMRTVLSHATHSVNDTASGPDATDGLAQLEANASFAQRWRSDRQVRGALGFHASATCSDELLRRTGRMAEELGCGVHFHLAEHEEDLLTTISRWGVRTVPRLEGFGLIGPGRVASYAHAIDAAEAERLARSRTLVALHPRAAAELTGACGLECLLAHRPLLGLGTEGRGTLWQQLAAAFASALQLGRAGRLKDPDALMAQLLISGPAELSTMNFGLPSGRVEEGAVADLAVFDTVPPSGSPNNVSASQLMQLAEVPVAWTVVAGRVVVREGQLVGASHLELAHEAARALESLWRRVDLSSVLG